MKEDPFLVNPLGWKVNGNIVNDQLDYAEDYSLYHSTLVGIGTNQSIASNNQANGGEDGTTTGFEAYNNQQTVLWTNLLPSGLSKGDTVAPLHKIRGDETFTVIEMAGGFTEHAVEIVCPGSQSSEGVYSDAFACEPNKTYTLVLIMGGSSGQSIRLELDEQNSSNAVTQSVFNPTSSYYDYGTGYRYFIIPITTTAAAAWLQFGFINYGTSAATYQYGGGYLIEGTELPPDWVEGGTSDYSNSVEIVNATKPADDYIRACFIEDTTPEHYPDLATLGGRGITDLFFIDHKMQLDLNTCRAHIETALGYAKQGGVNFHLIVSPFAKFGIEDYADPADMDYRAEFLDTIQTLIDDFPNIDGISLNDFIYPDEYWLTDTEEERTANRATMVAFATAVRDVVHSNNKLFSVNILECGSHDGNLDDIAPLCDYIITELYRGMGSCPSDATLDESHIWFKGMLEEAKSILSGINTPLLCTLIGYDWARDSGAHPDQPQYVTEDIQKDFNIIFDADIAGYIFCEIGYAPWDIYFPDGKPQTGQHSIRVSTTGKAPGEGVKIPISAIVTGNSYDEKIALKIPLGLSVLVGLGSNNMITMVGDGTYQTINLKNEPDDPNLYIKNDDAQTITYYIDSLKLNPINESGLTIDTSVLVETAGTSAWEGVQEQPSTIDVSAGDMIWYSVYLKGSGTVELLIFERDNFGNIIRDVESLPLTLTEEPQELHNNIIIQTGVLVDFKVLTPTAQDISFEISGVYANRGDTPRTGQNLVIDNIANTGSNGTTDGLAAAGEDTIISVLSNSDKLELRNNTVS